MPRILMIVGSLRKQSFNHQLAREIERVVGDRRRGHFLDWGDVPLMNQDDRVASPGGGATRSRRRTRRRRPVVLLARIQLPDSGRARTSSTGSRTLDEHDRTSPSAIKGKRAAISGVGGRNATAGMRKDLERLFSAMGVQIIGGPSLGISLTPEEWSSDVLTPEPGTLGALQGGRGRLPGSAER